MISLAFFVFISAPAVALAVVYACRWRENRRLPTVAAQRAILQRHLTRLLNDRPVPRNDLRPWQRDEKQIAALESEIAALESLILKHGHDARHDAAARDHNSRYRWA